MICIDLEQAKDVIEVSPMLLGGNISYFNDLDEVWQKYNLQKIYREAGVGCLRYPGGEETSRYHWEHPGVNGYVDFWTPSTYQQTWMTTYAPPEQWDTNEQFMNIDEFLGQAQKIGAEPLVGINMSSGVLLDRINDSIDEAVRLIRHVKQKGYIVKYWYFDNEPWHKSKSNYVRIPIQKYAELCVQFAKAMRKVDSHAKFIANPLDGGYANRWDKLQPFLEIAGEHINMLDFHWYWEFDSSSWQTFVDSKPMRNSSKWRSYDKAYTYTQMIRQCRTLLKKHGYSHIQIAALEWNVGPQGKETQQRITDNQYALIQAEMMMQFIDGDLDAACLWPIFWQINAPSDQAQKRAFRSWLEPVEPFATTPAYQILKLISVASHAARLHAQNLTTDQAIPTLAVRRDDGKVSVFVLNKFEQDKSLALKLPNDVSKAIIHQFTESDGLRPVELIACHPKRSFVIQLTAKSLTRIDLVN